MKKIKITFLLILLSAGALYAGAKQDSTWFRQRLGNKIKYILIPAEQQKSELASITQVQLGKVLYTPGGELAVKVKVYNVLFKNYLAVFSVMPSYTSPEPIWKKIDLDTIKNKIVSIGDLKTLVETTTVKAQPKSSNNLKYYNYVLLVKRTDGWYCSDTDCFADFFQIINDPSQQKSKAWQINIAAPLLSVAEYEASYRRKKGAFSQNYPFLMGNNSDTEHGDFLLHSFIDTIGRQKQHHYWIMSSWVHDGVSLQRGMERFIFVPAIGVTGASYDFFMPQILIYWQSILDKKFTLLDREKAIGNAEYSNGYEFLDYMNEYTLPRLDK